MSAQNKCLHDHDDFCFVCGHRLFLRIKKSQAYSRKRQISETKFRTAYRALFNIDPLDRNIQWSPQVLCNACHTQLAGGKGSKILTPMQWGEPKNHPHDCYFCQTVIPPGITKKRKSQVQYPDVTSVKKAKFIAPANLDTSASLTVYDDEASEDQGMPDFQEEELEEASGAAEKIDSHTAEYDADDIEMHAEEEFNAPGTSSGQDVIQKQSQPKEPTASSSSTPDVSPLHPRLREIQSTELPSPSSGSSWAVPKHYSRLKPRKQPKAPIALTQERLNDLIRDLD